jgi:hypothetical protein
MTTQTYTQVPHTSTHEPYVTVIEKTYAGRANLDSRQVGPMRSHIPIRHEVRRQAAARSNSKENGQISDSLIHGAEQMHGRSKSSYGPAQLGLHALPPPSSSSTTAVSPSPHRRVHRPRYVRRNAVRIEALFQGSIDASRRTR